MTRISESITEWQVDGVGTGPGLSEYLDQIIGDQPVGVSEEDVACRRADRGVKKVGVIMM